MLLAEPLERTPLRARGRVVPTPMAEVLFFIAAHRRRSRARSGSWRCATRSTACSRSSSTCSRSRRCSCCCGGVRRRRAGRRLRRRGDGALRVRRRLRRRRGAEPLRAPVGRGQRGVAVAASRCALFVELCDRRARLGPEGASTPRAPPYAPGFGAPEQIGELLLTKFLLPFEVASLPAAHRRRRRRGARAPARRHRRSTRPTRVAAMDFTRPPGVGTMAEAVGGRRPREPPELGPRRGERERQAGRAAGEHRLVPRRLAR